jgi:hypothetical protein
MAYRLSVDIKSGSVQRLSQFAGVVARAADCGQRGRDDRPLRQAKPNRDSIHQPYWYPHASEALWARRGIGDGSATPTAPHSALACLLAPTADTLHDLEG